MLGHVPTLLILLAMTFALAGRAAQPAVKKSKRKTDRPDAKATGVKDQTSDAKLREKLNELADRQAKLFAITRKLVQESERQK